MKIELIICKKLKIEVKYTYLDDQRNRRKNDKQATNTKRLTKIKK